MADAWGGSWASAWGVSWGDDGSAPPAPTPDTHDGGYTRREIEDLRKRVKRFEEAREHSEKERRRTERLLVTALDKAYRQVVDRSPDPVEAAPEIIAEAAIPTKPTDSAIAPRVPDWKAMLQDIGAIQRTIAVLDQRMRDEEDVEILLLAV